MSKVIDITGIFGTPTPTVSQPSSDFEEQPHIEQPGNFSQPPAPVPPPAPAAEDTEELPMEPEEIAEMLVDAVDMVQQWAYPALYNKIVFTKEERSDLKELLKKLKAAKREGKIDSEGNIQVTLSPYDQELIEKHDESIAYEEELVPLEEKEINWLKKPLSKLLAASKYKVSPASGLIVAALIVTLPRALPLLAKIGKK